MSVDKKGMTQGTPQPKMSLESSSVSVVCDMVTTEPYRRDMFSRIKVDLELFKANFPASPYAQLGDRIVDFFFSSESNKAVRNMIHSHQIGLGKRSVVWDMTIDDARAGQFMSRAWAKTTPDQWRSMCAPQPSTRPVVASADESDMAAL